MLSIKFGEQVPLLHGSGEHLSGEQLSYNHTVLSSFNNGDFLVDNIALFSLVIRIPDHRCSLYRK